MKTVPKQKYALIAYLGLSIGMAFSHGVAVHQAITANAAASALNDSSAYAGFVGTISSDLPYSGQNGAVSFLILGSAREDAPVPGIPLDAGGKRSLNHFYDPLDTTYGKGLSDVPPDDRKLIANNSFTWGSKSNSPGLHIIEGTTINQWSWQNARGYEWLGLTLANQSDRQANLANMFRSVGQVVHLLEDNSQPQHVRNEQHLDEFPGVFSIFPSPWLSPIEEYSRKHVAQLNYQAAVLDWRSDGFTKLEDFWDRHLYNGSAAALNAAENGGTGALGLAEWCNGNFLGARHLFPEYFNPRNIEYYPFPSRDHSTDYSDAKSHPANHLDDLTLENGKQGKGIYLAKTADGIQYQHIARVNYFGAKFPNLNLFGTPYCTIADPNVLKDYHDNLIPKAVEYSAGLLDYFFRGTLDVSLGLGNAPGNFCLTIKNRSGADFSGGEFHIYSEDHAGNRSGISTTNLTGTLNNGASANLEFTPPQITPVAYVVVYRGTIGASNSVALDPVDANIAIAAKRFTTCGLDNDDLTPTTLTYDDFSDLGTIQLDRSSPKTSFGSFPLGIYQIMYVDGVYHSHTRSDAPPPLTPGADQWGTRWGGGGDPYGTSAYYFRADGNEYDTRTLPGTRACDTSSSEDVVAATLEANPAIQFMHTGGAIGLQPHTAVWICNNWEIADTGGPTYRLERLRSFYPQPNRIRIQNYDEVIKPLFASTNCAVYMDASGAPEWDGSFNDRYLGSETVLWWDSPGENIAVNGKVMDFASVTYVPFPCLQLIQCGAGAGWEVEIDSLTSEGDWITVWQGWKITGTTPVGTYFKGNADPSLCDFGPDCIYIESY